MRCPFCGNEMTPGGLYLTTHPLHPDPIRWVPQAEDRDTGYAPWGSREAIPMVGSLEDEAARRTLSQQLFSALPDAEGWFCPFCRKAIGIFDRLDVSDEAPEEPWNSSGLFGRKKEFPPWEG